MEQLNKTKPMIQIQRPATPALPGELRRFLSRLYSPHKNFAFWLAAYQNSYQYCVTSNKISLHQISLRQPDQLLGQVALIQDQRLPISEAFFGFLEFIDDPPVFNELWRQLIALAIKHRIATLKGPVNGSIWHQYRCIKADQGDEYFITEPITPPYYYRYLSQQEPSCEVGYSSGVRTSFPKILNTLRANQTIHHLATQGFSLRRQNEVMPEQLADIIKVSKSAFANSWGYTALADGELANLYDLNQLNAYLYRIYLLYQDTSLIGYLSTLRAGRSLICKTICLRPEFQGRGLGHALALAVHQDAAVEHFADMRYVLVRDGNQVHHYPTDDVSIFRQYVAFDYILKS